MPTLELFALGTPVMDGFAQVDGAFLSAHKLVLGSSNFMNNERLAVLEKALGPKIRSWEPGDNARNVCESYVRLQKLNHAADAGVAYAGTLGNDETATRFVSSLKTHGIKPMMQYVNGSSGRILALITPGGGRTFAVSLGVSEQYSVPAEMPACKCFFVTSITLLTPASISRSSRAMVDRMKREGARIALALESPAMLGGKREEAYELAKKADVLFLNEEEMGALGLDEEALAKLAPLVYLKKGANGSTVFKDGAKLADVPVHPAKKVVDTTGAGDNYAAGVLWALNNGKSELEAARIGSQLGSAVVGKSSAGARKPPPASSASRQCTRTGH